MKGFVLPSLQSSSKRPVWTSQVTLPSLPLEATASGSTTALPLIDKSSRKLESKRLKAKAAALEAEEHLEHLLSLEQKIRSVICGREHEKRHRMIWQYQKEKAKVERETAVIEAKALALQRSMYMRAVLQHQERGRLFHIETFTRAKLLTEEEDERRHLTSVCRLDFLAVGRRQALREMESAEYLAQEFKTIRDWESRIAATSFCTSKPFAPVTQLVLCRNVGTGAYRGREDLLMDYTICEEERGRRLELLATERTACLLLEWQHSAAKLMLVAEPNARAALEEMCLYGSCQARLAALLRVQRWWRMLRAVSWKERGQRDLKQRLQDRRRQMTSRDYHKLLRRLKQKSRSSTAHITFEKLRSAMAALERAAELSYQYLFDYFVYTLMNRAANLQEIEAHRLRAYPLEKDDGMSCTPQVSRLLCVPYRLFVRQQPLQPYPIWRVVRWIEGSTLFMRQVQLLEEAETHERREVLMPQEEQCRDTLRLYSAALKRGPWAWRSLYVAICSIEEEEAVCRNFVHIDEQAGRDILFVDARAAFLRCAASWENLSRLIQDEERERLALVEAEHAECVSLTEGEWRWKNLLQLRKKLCDSRGGKMRWRMASNFGLARRFVSLDTTASVIQRFFHMLRYRARRLKQAARRKRASGTAGERQLKATAAELVSLLAAQHNEAKKEEIVAAAAAFVDDRFSHERAKVSAENAVKLFCAWFDEKASEPMQQQYETIVARFLSSHKEFYKKMHALFAVMRQRREETEKQAEQEYLLLWHTATYINILLSLLPAQEAAQRQRLEADAAAERLALCERADLLLALTTCTAAAYDERGTSCKERPLLSKTERLLSREEIRRTRLTVAKKQGDCALLLYFHAAIRESLMREEQQQRTEVCDSIENLWRALSPLSFLLQDEKIARREVESAAFIGYGDVLERAHALRVRRVLYPKFLRERLAFETEARYFDKRLTELLFRRVVFVNTKLEELAAAEVCARKRVEYLEETDRCLRLLSA